MDLLLKTIPAVARELSGATLTAQFFLIVKLWYFALTRKLGICKSDFAITGTAHNRSITFYLRYVMDIAVLREVFVEKEYEWFPVENPKVIIDLGAHFGDTTLYYANKYPDARIIAVEPSPENFERLVKHAKNHSNIIPVQAAVGGTDGEIILHLMPSSLGHSVFDRKGSAESVKVPQFILKTLFEKYNIQKADIIKFDIEGAEFDLFSSIRPLDMSQTYIGEVHYDLTDNKTINFDDFFRGAVIEKTQLQNDKRFLVKVKTNSYEHKK